MHMHKDTHTSWLNPQERSGLNSGVHAPSVHRGTARVKAVHLKLPRQTCHAALMEFFPELHIHGCSIFLSFCIPSARSHPTCVYNPQRGRLYTLRDIYIFQCIHFLTRLYILTCPPPSTRPCFVAPLYSVAESDAHERRKDFHRLCYIFMPLPSPRAARCSAAAHQRVIYELHTHQIAPNELYRRRLNLTPPPFYCLC